MVAVLFARAIGRPLAERRADLHRGVVDGVYAQATNLLFGEALVCLVSSGAGNGPLNVLVELPHGRSFASLGLAVGQPAEWSGEQIQIGHQVVVQVGDAAIWEARPIIEAGPIRLEQLQRALAIVLEVLVQEEGREGFAPLAADGVLGFVPSRALSGGAWPRGGKRGKGHPTGTRGTGEKGPSGQVGFQAALLARAQAGISELVVAARAGDLERAAAAAGRLAGLGPGLTPSGDDFLAGFLASWATLRPTQICNGVGPATDLTPRPPSLAGKGEPYSTTTPPSLAGKGVGGLGLPPARLAEAILVGARGRTGPMSLAWLACAARGEVPEAPKGLLEAIAAWPASATGAGASNDLVARARAVLAHGATSGGDLLLGVLVGGWLGVDVALGGSP